MSNEIQVQDYLVTKNDGTQFVLYGAKLDLEEVAKQMNGHEVQWLVLGGKLLLKNMIISIEPANIIYNDEEKTEVVAEPIID